MADAAILAIPGMGIYLLPISRLFPLFLVMFAYNWYFWMVNKGQTPGKMLVGIRVIRADGSPLTSVDVLLRTLGFFVSMFVFLLGFLWLLVDRDGQGWHDKIADTRVIMARR